jgi:hypothetical protein
MRRRVDLASALVHGPRPGQPQGDLGGGDQAQRRGHDRVLDHPVPGGGRPAR